MFKKIIAAFLSKLIGKAITVEMLDVVIEFVSMLIDVFGSVSAAENHLWRATKQAKQVKDRMKARAIFVASEAALQKVSGEQ